MCVYFPNPFLLDVQEEVLNKMKKEQCHGEIVACKLYFNSFLLLLPASTIEQGEERTTKYSISFPTPNKVIHVYSIHSLFFTVNLGGRGQKNKGKTLFTTSSTVCMPTKWEKQERKGETTQLLFFFCFPFSFFFKRLKTLKKTNR